MEGEPKTIVVHGKPKQKPTLWGKCDRCGCQFLVTASNWCCSSGEWHSCPEAWCQNPSVYCCIKKQEKPLTAHDRLKAWLERNKKSGLPIPHNGESK